MSLPPLPEGFTLDSGSHLPPLPEGFTLDRSEQPDTFKQRGVKQPDGTWIVPTPDGPVHLDEDGNPLDSVHTPGGSGDVNALSKEGVLNRVLAVAQGGAQGFVPQVAGVVAATKGGDYFKARDEARRAVDQATEEAGVGYQIAGGIATTAGAAPASLAGRLALSSGLGAVNAAAESGGDLEATAKGAGIGLAAGVGGELIGKGIGKITDKVLGTKAAAIANQTDKDARAVEKEIATLKGQLGAETQKGSRLLENVDRFAAGHSALEGESRLVGEATAEQMANVLESPEARRLAEKVATSSAEKVPGQTGTIERLEVELAKRQAGAAAEAAKRTADYFATPLWQSEVLPRLKILAPRFGLAAGGAALGELYDAATGTNSHTGAFVGAVLGAPGVRAMMQNIAKSNRVRVAIANNLAPILATTQAAIARGFVPTVATLASSTLHESALGDPQLAAEQLVARGGIGSVLASRPPDVGTLTGLDEPQTPLDAAIHRTVGLTAMAAAIESHHDEVDKRVKRLIKGEGEKPAPKPPPPDVHELTANPEALVDRVANNLGSAHSVAPGVATAMAGVAQRAAAHLSTLSAEPPPKGPLAPTWHRGRAETRVLEQAAAAIDDPLSLVDHAAAGTLTRAHVDAAKAVYPMLVQTIGDRALDLALDSKGRLPYRQRQMLSLLTGIDVDGSRAGTAANQRAIAAPSVKPSNAPMGQSKGDASVLTLGQRMAPGTTKERDK